MESRCPWDASRIRPIPDGYDPVQDGAALLFFSMDTCPWCKRATPAMETVAKTLGCVVPVYKVGPEHPLTQVMQVSGFPTIKYIDNFGASFDYAGPREPDPIVSFVCNNSATRHSVCTKYFS